MATNNARNNKGQFPVGSVVTWNFSAPADTRWLLTNGASLDTTTWAALFSIIGYDYGGSGSNFNLPTIATSIIRGS